ncbi:unnamed protein product [Lupinus luteus]|uniref:LysM domain-containing protein n=1 Tax=Lupinus luteus TaxID=3873 RepID=A0AAV1W964_LUPLU
MPNLKPISQTILTLFLSQLLLINVAQVTSKSTIEPCTNSDSCNALLSYTLYTDLKVSEVASLFQIDPISLLTANAIDISYLDVEHHILPSRLSLKIPISCSCVDGIRKKVSTHYKTRPSDSLSSIVDLVYGGLVSADQLREANSITDTNVLDVGQNLVVPLPCTCFNGTDNSLPAIYLSYVVKQDDNLAAIAASYFTTLTDLMNVNALGSTAIADGDILAIPIPACASNFPRYAADYGLLVPNGSYAITAGRCVQCSCGPETGRPQEFLDLIAPPTTVTRESIFAPAPAPQSDGSGLITPKSSVLPSTGFSPANGPISGIASDASAACSLVNPLPTTMDMKNMPIRPKMPAQDVMFGHGNFKGAGMAAHEHL